MKDKKTEKKKEPEDAKPRVRGTWEINPETQVKESDKIYRRARQKSADHKEIDEIIDFFGD